MKKHKQSSIAIAFMLFVLIAHLVTPTFSLREPVFHGAAGEFVLSGMAYGGTMDLEWIPQSGAKEYLVLFHESDESQLEPIDTTESFGLSLAPFRPGFYAIEANTKIGTERSNTLLIER